MGFADTAAPVAPGGRVFEGLGTEISQEILEVAVKTNEFLERRGWCLWKCAALGDEVIVVTRDETVEGFPIKYAVYTEAELGKLLEVEDDMLRIIHEAKKEGAKVEV